MRWMIAVAAGMVAVAAQAQDVGQIKSVRGTAHVERMRAEFPDAWHIAGEAQAAAE